jgi:hypothetical protein
MPAFFEKKTLEQEMFIHPPSEERLRLKSGRYEQAL